MTEVFGVPTNFAAAVSIWWTVKIIPAKEGHVIAALSILLARKADLHIRFNGKGLDMEVAIDDALRFSFFNSPRRSSLVDPQVELSSPCIDHPLTGDENRE